MSGTRSTSYDTSRSAATGQYPAPQASGYSSGGYSSYGSYNAYPSYGSAAPTSTGYGQYSTSYSNPAPTSTPVKTDSSSSYGGSSGHDSRGSSSSYATSSSRDGRDRDSSSYGASSYGSSNYGSSGSSNGYSGSGSSSSYNGSGSSSSYNGSGSSSSYNGSGSSGSGSSSSYGGPGSSSSYGGSGSSSSYGGSSYGGPGSSYGSSSRGGPSSRGYDDNGSSRYSSSGRYDSGSSRDSYGSRGGGYRDKEYEDSDAYTKATLDNGGEEDQIDVNDEKSLFSTNHNTGINFNKYNEIPVSVRGLDVRPCESWNDCKLHPLLLDNIRKVDYKAPTPVQKYSMPICATGRDLMASAQTGSGKTAAFLFPVINNLLAAPLPPRSHRIEPSVVVLAPTRELVSQINIEAVKFCFRTQIRSVVVYGGVSALTQIRQLEDGCDIIVGTPGRLLDLVDRGKIFLSRVRYLILDEADRMLDMGFEKQIRDIVQNRDMPDKRDRQTLMFSATFPKDIRQLASDFLRESYVFLKVGRVGSTTESITQRIRLVDMRFKQGEVLKDVRAIPGKTLIFVETKRDTDSLARYLFSQGLKATGIHGDRSQREREAALRSFKVGTTQVLVATDVAARGLDIDDVAHVINYDLPGNIDSYVHRIGRTGRAGNIGQATAYFCDSNKNISKELVKLLTESNQAVPEWLIKSASENRGGPMKRGGMGGPSSARYTPYSRSGPGGYGAPNGGYGAPSGYAGPSGGGSGYGVPAGAGYGGSGSYGASNGGSYGAPSSSYGANRSTGSYGAGTGW